MTLCLCITGAWLQLADALLALLEVPRQIVTGAGRPCFQTCTAHCMGTTCDPHHGWHQATLVRPSTSLTAVWPVHGQEIALGDLGCQCEIWQPMLIMLHKCRGPGTPRRHGAD